jgi:hypothetical protein
MDEQYLRDLYTQVLGREPDPEGFAHNLALLESGAINIGELTNAFVTSPEAQQNSIPAAQEQKAAQGLLGGQGINTEERAKELADQVYGAYSSNVNYDAELNELNSLAAIDPEAFYKSRINLLGKQMGWQVGQNTSGENVKYQAELNSLLAGAQQAGLSPEEVNTLVTTGANQANRENQERIARDAARGEGWVNQNIPGGYLTLGALAAAIAAPYALGALGSGAAAGGAAAGGAAAGGAAAGAGLSAAELLAIGGFAPTVGSGASFIVPGALAAGGGAAAAGGLEAYMAAAGLNPGTFTGASFALPGALSVAPEVASALNTANFTLPTIPGAAPYTPSAFGTLTPPLTGSGAVAGGMSTAIPGVGLTGALPSGVLVGNGTLGTTMGATYMAAGPGQFAVDAMGNAIPASSVGIDGFAPASGISNALSSLGNVLNSPLGRLGVMGGLSALSGGGQQQQPVPQMAGGGTYAPKGQVDYRPIIDLLAPRQISRTSLLG